MCSAHIVLVRLTRLQVCKQGFEIPGIIPVDISLYFLKTPAGCLSRGHLQSKTHLKMLPVTLGLGKWYSLRLCHLNEITSL